MLRNVDTCGFAPILGDRARVLILGSLPSVASLEKNQYYGHPQNVFWRIMGELFGAGPDMPYAQRTRILVNARVAVWDVLRSSVRPGSMDADIETSTAKPNDFETLFRDQPGIRLVCFNGRTAAKFFEQLVAPVIENGSNSRQYETLPSTSPAHASLSFADKLERWRIVQRAARTIEGEG
jgi:TDG/mug DNA glycosylase family protein